jgi:hypothetical protein
MEKKFVEWLKMALKLNKMHLIAKRNDCRSGLKRLLEAVWILTGLKALVMAFGKQKEGGGKIQQANTSYVYFRSFFLLKKSIQINKKQSQ